MNLNENQKKAFDQIGSDWAQCPVRIRAATLLSLQDKGLVECRMNPTFGHRYLGYPYTSFAYQWKRKLPTP